MKYLLLFLLLPVIGWGQNVPPPYNGRPDIRIDKPIAGRVSAKDYADFNSRLTDSIRYDTVKAIIEVWRPEYTVFDRAYTDKFLGWVVIYQGIVNQYSGSLDAGDRNAGYLRMDKKTPVDHVLQYWRVEW